MHEPEELLEWSSAVGCRTGGYVAKEGRALRPESRGRVLTAFLQAYFRRYVDYGFTAGLEDQLDTITGERQCQLSARWQNKMNIDSPTLDGSIVHDLTYAHTVMRICIRPQLVYYTSIPFSDVAGEMGDRRACIFFTTAGCASPSPVLRVGAHAGGGAAWKEVLRDFWVPFEGAVSAAAGIPTKDVVDALDPLICVHFLPVQASRPSLPEPPPS